MTSVYEKLQFARGAIRQIRDSFVQGKALPEVQALPAHAQIHGLLDSIIEGTGLILTETEHPEPTDWEALAHETANRARARKRNEFQNKYGFYVKCSKCGRFLGTLRAGESGSIVGCPDHDAEHETTNGYAPPPR